MVTQINYSLYTLEPGEARALPRRARQTICALDHPLWLSQQGQLADAVVAGGDRITLSGRGLIVVQAFGERASFRVAHAATLRVRLVALARRYLPAAGDRAWRSFDRCARVRAFCYTQSRCGQS